jgi:hypothetical protein
MGEDFMRKIQKLGESSVRGNKATAVSQKMMMHYRNPTTESTSEIKYLPSNMVTKSFKLC